jgi:hypothetical protein
MDNVKHRGNAILAGGFFMMTRKTKFLIFCLVILLGAAFLTYRAYFGPQIAAARQREEAMKLAELEADLRRAAAAGGGKIDRSGRMSRRRTRSSPRAGST